jgi:hypothetical protein
MNHASKIAAAFGDAKFGQFMHQAPSDPVII